MAGRTGTPRTIAPQSQPNPAKAEEEFFHRDFDFVGLVGEDLFDAGGEGFADGEAGFHDAFAVDLGEVVIGEEEMDLAGEIAFQFGGLEKHVPTAFSAGGIEAIAVDQFVKDQMTRGIFIEGDVADEFFIIAAVIVQVAGHPQLALGGEIHRVEIAEGRVEVFVGGDLESFDDALGGGRHSSGFIGVNGARFVNDDLLGEELNTKARRHEGQLVF